MKTVSYSLLADPSDADLEAVVHLYRQAGWWWHTGTHLEAARRIVAGSHCFCVARHKQAIVGMGRAISDRASDAYIQDLTVAKPFRHQGVASGIVRILTERLRADGISWIGVVAAGNCAPLYRALGFAPMTNAQALLLEC